MASIDERKREYYYNKAKEEGYRSRASYKLKQLQKKFYIIKRGNVVVDLGAAPGGWSQVASEYVGSKGKVVAVDKQAILPFEKKNIEILRLDMRRPDLAEKIEEVAGSVADVVLSDLAGNVTGNWSLDADRQNYLVLLALNACHKILKPGGIFVTKVFRGPTIQELDGEIKPWFEKIRRFRPPATRKRSAEEYYVCMGYKGNQE
ncbi:MAG: RlmE family RNA methyltransferase [Methanobacteriota archaeon]|nr:MAG: RlmE family RNA methyltransferase [Euryarchaeota archaeon]